MLTKQIHVSILFLLAVGFSAQSQATPSSAQDFFGGLWAAPGTPARVHSGELLDQWLQGLEQMPSQNTDPSDNDPKQRVYTQSILHMTADYLKAPQACAADQKVRLYRGVGSHQLIQHGTQYLSPWSPWTYNAAMTGATIPAEAAQDNFADPEADLRYKLLTHHFDPSQAVNLQWYFIASNHSGDGSAVSALLSTSLESTISTDFAHPYLMVLDVCLERALALSEAGDGFATFSEAEIYLPLFALPEEIVAVIPWPAANPFARVPETYTNSTNGLTRSLRRVFFAHDLPFDVQYLTKIAIKIPETDAGLPSQSAYVRGYNPESFYDLIKRRFDQGLTIDQWRQAVMPELSKIAAQPETCDYSYKTFTQSDVFKNGSHPKHAFTFATKQVLPAAVFDLKEYQTITSWRAAWKASFKDLSDSSPQSVRERWANGDATFAMYFENFENVHLVNDKLYVDYVQKCKAAP